MGSDGRRGRREVSDAEPEIQSEEPRERELLIEPLDDDRIDAAGRRFLVLVLLLPLPPRPLLLLLSLLPQPLRGLQLASAGRDRDETGVKQ